MPIYEYRCTSCGQLTEVIQKISDPPLTECTACSGPLEKLVSVAAFQLKGGGWFSDGYGGRRAADAPKTEGAPAKTNGKPAAESGGAPAKKGSGGTADTPKRKAAGGGCGSGCGCGH